MAASLIDLKPMDPVYSKNPDVVFRQIADEFILVPIRQKVVDLKSIYTLNDAAAFIWGQIDGKKGLGSVQEALCREFDIDATRAEADLKDIFLQWESLGLVQRL